MMFKNDVETKTRNLALRLRHTGRNRRQNLLERFIDRVGGQRQDAIR